MLVWDYRMQQSGIIIGTEGNVIDYKNDKGVFSVYKDKCHMQESIPVEKTKKQLIEERWAKMLLNIKEVI